MMYREQANSTCTLSLKCLLAWMYNIASKMCSDIDHDLVLIGLSNLAAAAVPHPCVSTKIVNATKAFCLAHLVHLNLSEQCSAAFIKHVTLLQLQWQQTEPAYQGASIYHNVGCMRPNHKHTRMMQAPTACPAAVGLMRQLTSCPA